MICSICSQDSLLRREALQHVKRAVPPRTHVLLEPFYWCSKLILHRLQAGIGQLRMFKVANNSSAYSQYVFYAVLRQHSLIHSQMYCVCHAPYSLQLVVFYSFCHISCIVTDNDMHFRLVDMPGVEHIGECIRNGCCCM